MLKFHKEATINTYQKCQLTNKGNTNSANSGKAIRQIHVFPEQSLIETGE